MSFLAYSVLFLDFIHAVVLFFCLLFPSDAQLGLGAQLLKGETPLADCVPVVFHLEPQTV